MHLPEGKRERMNNRCRKLIKIIADTYIKKSENLALQHSALDFLRTDI